MLLPIPDNLGFQTEFVSTAEKPLTIGIIDADLLDHGTHHPNLALMKISAFCKDSRYNKVEHNVRLICDYGELGNLANAELQFDLLVVSQVFKFTRRPNVLDELIEKHLIFYGGTGFFEINGPKLPDIVEHHLPDYHLYDEFIDIATGGDEAKKASRWDDYLNYSIGFTTRGCIRHCGFCVNRLLNKVESWAPVSEFLDTSRPRIYLWDDNIMAAPPKVFKKVMDELQATGKPFQFRQGMDIRLMTDEKAILLSDVKYYGDYIFAFDHYRMDIPEERRNVEQTLAGLEVWRRHCAKSTKLYVLVAYDSQDEKDIEGTFYRIKTLMEYGCLPYIMRFEKYAESKYKALYTQLARWCNQPSFFKKMSFRQYCVRNEEYHQGIQQLVVGGQYNTRLIVPPGAKLKAKHCLCYQSMIDFEKDFPKIAAKYFDLRYEDLKNKYKESR